MSRMSALSFRNAEGDVVELKDVPVSDAKKSLGAIFEDVAAGRPVAILKHNQRRAVLLSIEDFDALTKYQADALARLTSRYDQLMATMQGDAHRKGADAFFAMSGDDMGKAALAATRGKM
jgi:prevent-host-death family protein